MKGIWCPRLRVFPAFPTKKTELPHQHGSSIRIPFIANRRKSVLIMRHHIFARFKNSDILRENSLPPCSFRVPATFRLFAHQAKIIVQDSRRFFKSISAFFTFN